MTYRERWLVLIGTFLSAGLCEGQQFVLNGAYTTTGPSTSCVAAAKQSTFLTTDLKVWLYVSVSGSQLGDTLELDFLQPSGALYSTTSTPPSAKTGDQCFDVFLPISGTPAANLTGTWTVRGYWNAGDLFSITFTIAKQTVTDPGGPTGVNLLRNPGGEETPGDPLCGAATFINGWGIDSPGASLCAYGATGNTLSPTDPGPPDRGSAYFSGGPDSFTSLEQHLDITRYGAAIDGGLIAYTFSGWLGGLGAFDDNVVATLTFRDAGSNQVGVARIGPVLAADRNNITGLLQRSANGIVPRSARSIDIVMSFTRVSGGNYNHASADSMSLVFTAPGTGGSTCTFTINPGSNSVAAAGGSSTVLITTQQGCNWGATSNASWITITSKVSGTGTGSITYQVSANTTNSLRTGTLTIAGQTHTVTQAPGCNFTLSRASSSFGAAGGTGTVLVATASFCPWTVNTSSSWITLVSGSAGTGFGGVKFSVATNSTAGARSGSLTVGGQTFTVSQSAAPSSLPTISAGGVVNAASYQPGGGIAQGSYFSIFGANLGPATPASQTSYPLQNSVGAVGVTVTQGSTTVNAIPVFVSATQINAIMPSNAPVGAAQIAVTYNGVTGPSAPVTIAATSFGIFSVAAGQGPGIIQNYVSASQLPLNSASGPAVGGQVEILLGTGLGAIAGADNVSPPAGTLPVTVSVTVGGKTATILYSGRAPGIAGVDQINFQVPADAPTGCFVPVQVQAFSSYSNTVTMAVSGHGEACSDAENPAGALTANGGRIGSVVLARTDVNAPLQKGQPNLALSMDVATGTFTNTTGIGSLGNMFLSAPPVGTCTSYSGGLDVGSLLGTGSGGLLGSAGRALDAGGSIAVVGGQQPVNIKPLDASGSSAYSGILGGSSTAGLTELPATLDGTIQVTGAGGKDVGSFKASAAMPVGVGWSNRSQITQINRSSSLMVTWTGGDASRLVMVAGSSTDQTTNASAGFFCLASAAAGSFTVPVSALANMPTTVGNATVAGTLMVGTMAGTYPTFTASGLDAGFVFEVNLAESAVDVQ